MKPIITISILFSLLAGSLYAQTGTSFKSSEKEYSFIFQDSPAKLFTMRQFDETALSLYRLSVNELNKVVSPKVSRLIQVGASALVFLPLTHEEGHRSILTNENIGSVSRPYVAYGGA